jgi:hypothetical protein
MFGKRQIQELTGFIAKPDAKEVERLLLQDEVQGRATFETAFFGCKLGENRFPGGEKPAGQIAYLLLRLHVSRTDFRDAKENLQEARANVGRLKRARTEQEQTEDEKQLQFALGARLVQYKLQLDALGALQNEFAELRTNLIEAMEHFKHDDVQLLLKHNIMCVQQLSDDASAYIAGLKKVDAEEYNRLTAWLAESWERFIKRFTPSR